MKWWWSGIIVAALAFSPRDAASTAIHRSRNVLVRFWGWVGSEGLYQLGKSGERYNSIKTGVHQIKDEINRERVRRGDFISKVGDKKFLNVTNLRDEMKLLQYNLDKWNGFKKDVLSFHTVDIGDGKVALVLTGGKLDGLEKNAVYIFGQANKAVVDENPDRVLVEPITEEGRQELVRGIVRNELKAEFSKKKKLRDIPVTFAK